MLRVLIVDDHQVLREGLRSLLANEEDIEVAGEAGDGRTAIEKVQELHPHLILMDINMPDMNGISASSKILADYPDAKIIILSIHSDKRFVEQAIRTGVHGYLLKNCAYDELVDAIRTVNRGQFYLSRGIADLVIEDYRTILTNKEKEPCPGDSLTTREREVLQLVAEGLTNKQIADRMNLGVKTIETYRQRIMDKLDIHNVAQLIKFAIREGITTLES